MMKHQSTPGINIQWPWSQLIVSGKKHIETRGYPIPAHYLGREIAIIQTPGPRGKKEAGIVTASIVGIVVFSNCYQYKSKQHWIKEHSLHRVTQNDPMFGFSPAVEKWAWVISSVRMLRKPVPAPKNRGIVFTKSCSPKLDS